MADADSSTRRYAMVAGLGALAGGVLVAVATKAVPRAMSEAMAGMMGKMMARMGEGEHALPDT
jgi:hypothetical protein